MPKYYFPTFYPCLHIIFSATPLLTPRLPPYLGDFLIPCDLDCGTSQHPHLLELLRNVEAHPDLLTQHRIWTRPPSKVLSFPWAVFDEWSPMISKKCPLTIWSGAHESSKPLLWLSMCASFTTWWYQKLVLLPQAGLKVCLVCSPGTVYPT